MEHDFWHQRWSEGRIGFHQSEINSLLLSNWQSLDLAEGSRVFVPLCGKSKDLLWLRGQGHQVVGNELSEAASEAFFKENNLQPERISAFGYENRSVDKLLLMTGDFFALRPDHLEGMAAVYDRAALIALPPEMRQQYAQKMCQVLPEGVKMLLITLEFEGDSGPPFSVSGEELVSLYGGRFELTRLQESMEGDRTEVCWLLVDKG